MHALAFRLVWGATKQVNIDDSVGDGTPTYFPASGEWEDENCAGCWLTPDKAKAFQGSWTAATYNPGKGPMYFDLTFEGIGIDVYFILANTQPRNPTADTKANFVLDGKTDGSPFTYAHDSTSNYYYNRKVYSKSGLSQAKHTLRVGITDGNEQGSYWLAFDYAVVTVNVPDPTTAAPVTTSPTSKEATTAPASSSSSSISSSASLSSVTSRTIVTSTTGNPATVATPTTSDSTNSSSSNNNQSQNDNTTSSNSTQASGASSNKGAMIGGIIAGVVIVAALLLLAFLFIRRRRRRDNKEYDNLMLAGGAASYFSDHQGSRQPTTPNTMSFAVGSGSGAQSAPSTSSHGLAPSRYTPRSANFDLYNPYANDSFAEIPRSVHETHAEELARRDARQQELETQMAEMRAQLASLQANQPGSSSQASNLAAEKAALRARVDDTQSQIDNLHNMQPPEYTPLP